MGSKIYDFLADSFLFEDSLIGDEFRSVSDNDLSRELQRYREFCLSAASELEQEVLLNKSSLKLFSGIREVSISLLKQSAFYIQQHVVYDPLFALTKTSTEQNKVFSKFLGMKDQSLDRARIARTLHYLKALTPMVAADYVKLLPTNYFFEPPESLPLMYSAKGFAERIPPSLHDFMHQRAIVESGKKVDKQIIFNGSFETGRIIQVRFEGHGFEDIHGYTLMATEVIKSDDAKRTIQVGMRLPDSPPDKETFDAWVYQSINQAAGDVYRRILLENIFSVKYGAFYLTNSPFIFRLLDQIVPIDNGIHTNSANIFLNMNLPFLDRVKSDVLMKVRMHDGEAFELFRLELDKQLRELRQIEDPYMLRIKTENLVHELSEVQIRQLDQKIGSLKKKFFAEAAVVGASLCGAIQSGGLTLPIALLAAFQGYKSLTDYRHQKSENPAFFLWRVLKES